jgi:uncharacterized membrane protein
VNDRAIRLSIAVVAAIGAALAAYLLYVRQTGGTLVCTSSACETVQSSPYAELFGIPVAAIGLLAYLTLALASWPRSELVRAAQAMVALIALAFSAYLLYVQLHVLDAICEWCLASDGVTTVATALVLIRLREPLNA